MRRNFAFALSATGLTLQAMWESPTSLWRRLRLGREEYLQRLVTTLILDGVAPPWNTPRSPSDAGRSFLRLLDEAACDVRGERRPDRPADVFVDEYLLPKLEEQAPNVWPDWAVLWPDRAWVIELKTEPGSHRADQLPYYLRLAAAAHPGCSLDLTYITGPLSKPGPAVLVGQRFSHVTWEQVVPLIKEAWGRDGRPEVSAYLEMVSMLVGNLSRITPSEQRKLVIGGQAEEQSGLVPDRRAVAPVDERNRAQADMASVTEPNLLLDLARATGADGRQRGVGAQDPEELEALRDEALAAIRRFSPDDVTRFVLPWLWHAGRTGRRALTPEGEEFGYELRFSRYKTVQVTA
jgi:hypothetical protein